MQEAQIQRYGRQILLREVGGRGQSKLLSRPVQVLVRSEAVDVAVAYLCAGGTPITLEGEGVGGFLRGTTLAAFNPEAGPPGSPWLTLRGAPSPAPGLQVVVVGSTVVWGACPACVKEGLPANDRLTDDPVTLGALVALVVQRLALDLAEATGRVTLRGGAPVTEVPPVCADHRLSP